MVAACRHQDENGAKRFPDTEPNTRALAGSLAPVAWPRRSGRDHGICAGERRPSGPGLGGGGGWILHLPCDRGNRISSFKQHLKYSLGDPKAKYGMACEVPSLDLLMPF